MKKIVKYIIYFVALPSLVFMAEEVDTDNSLNHPWSSSSESGNLSKIGDFGFPSNPMNDRAIGYLFKGKAKSAVTNYGEFIEWDVHPAGLWGNYAYLPDVAFVTGVPGQSYSYKYTWYTNSTNTACPESTIPGVVLWCSDDAYDDPNELNPSFSWYEYEDTNFVSIVFDSYDDDGIIGEQKSNYDLITGDTQWVLDDLNQIIIISLEEDGDYVVDPNRSNVYGNPLNKKTVGFVYPWALRPSLKQRLDDFDLFDYGDDNEEWTADDDYVYYGANTAESWFTRWNPSSNTDWQPTTSARENTHNTDVSAGDIFGNEIYVSESNTYPLLAHSEIQDTWPEGYDDEGNLVKLWPGGYAESYDPEGTNCFPAYRWNDDCWVETDRFISNQDVYMEFDDRWAHRGSNVTNNIYEQKGYPLGLQVMATAHSYSVAFAEDIMFVTVNVRNESGDNWCAFEKNRYGDKVYLTDDDGNLICGDAMVLPDGTKLNGGEGFTYRDVSMGFYMDADVVSTDAYGNFGVHTNDDDFMEYYDCANPDIVPEGCKVINDDTLRVSVAMIYDYDNRSGAATDIGIVATQLLDSPYATNNVDLNGDGYFDIYVGDKLKMTDWHWFDWYNRPGVVYREGDAGCCAGDPGAAQAANKEEIQYKIIAGDTTNLSDDEKMWFFHTANPDLDSDTDLNPHFDSLEGLSQTSFFEEGSDGLDCVLQMSSGPFSIEVGEQVPFSFCIIFGQNKADLIENARFAQLMYNSHYQGYTEPDYPTVTATFNQGMITLRWDDVAERSTDVVTGYSDFEGYKIYKSIDGGSTWGTPQDKIYDSNGNHVGWVPYAQFHLTAEEDYTHCVYSNNYHGEEYCSDSQYETEGECLDNDNGYCDDENQLTQEACNSSGGQWNLNDWLVFDCGDDDNDGMDDIRGLNVCGPDPQGEWFSLGDCSDNTGIPTSVDELGNKYHEFIDNDVIDGIEYTYSVTAYDMGIAPDYTLVFNPENGVIDTSYYSANPLHFATPNGYQFIETGRGTSANDKNFVTVTSGPVATESLTNNIKVVPNPYIVHSNFNETEYTRKIRFTHLPQKCKITIFTISGEKVNTLNHDDVEDGSLFWNLRTMNNQEIAPGLYIYAVEDLSDNGTGEKFIGKFAIVR